MTAALSLSSSPRKRPDILLRPDLNALTDQAIAAIADRPDLRVYVRGRMLVTIARDGSATEHWLRRAPAAPVVVQLTGPAVLRIMDESAQWLKCDGRKKVQAPTMPPMMIATQILALHAWPFPYLEGVIESPTLRPDGSLVDCPGYDDATALLYEPTPGVHFPAIAERPTRDDAGRASAVLLEPVKDFPFVADTDRAAFVAVVLTLLARRIIRGAVPMFAVRAPTPGTGKSLLAHIIGIVGTGHEPAVMSMTEADELRKRITALALSGTPLILLDDVSGSLGSDVLAGALTATTWEDRLLGQTEMVRLPLRAVWLATGNNLGFQRTLGRRVIPIDLDARVEHPEDRTEFQHRDLGAYVRAVRPELVGAALTMLRAFLAAGAPAHKGTRLGSFEQWDDVVRSCVIWAGLADPAAADDPNRGRGRIRAQADDDIADLAAFYAELTRAFGTTTWTAPDVWQRKDDDGALRASLEAVGSSRRNGAKALSLRSLRYLFRGCANRPVRGMMLARVNVPNAREQSWCMTKVDANSCRMQDETGSSPATRGEMAVNMEEAGGERSRSILHPAEDGRPAGTGEGWEPDATQLEALDA